MTTLMRWVVGLVVVLHGLIHVLGAAKGLRWADVTALREPISGALGAGWLAAAVLVVSAAVMLVRAVRLWWVACAAAAVLSQAIIVTSWSDAKAGTLVNAILLGAFLYGYASMGRRPPAPHHPAT